MTPKRLADDHLLRGSLFLLLATTVAAALGLVFWLLAAHLYTAAAVGNMTTLFSATSLISYLSLLGLNSTIIRFLPRSAGPGGLVCRAIATVFCVGMLSAAAYLLLIPTLAPGLMATFHQPARAFAFVGFTAFASVNLLTDSVFVARRAAQYNVLVDGVLQGTLKVALLPALTVLGAYGLYVAFGIAGVIAVVVSVWLIHSKLQLKFTLRGGHGNLRSNIGYSFGTYLSSVLNLLPILLLPLLVLSDRGSSAAGFYYVAFQIANLLNAVSYAVGEAMFNEASQVEAQIRSLVVRAGRLLLVLQSAAAGLVVICAPEILRVFGGSYESEGTTTLRVLAVGALAVAFNTWASFILKALNMPLPMVVSNLVYCIVIGVVAFMGLRSGLVFAAWAWLSGNLAAGSVAVVALAWSKARRGTMSRRAPG